MTTAYPLCWPVGRPRTARPEKSRFDTTAGRAVSFLKHELRLLGAKDLIVSSNMKLRQDGLPYASGREPDDVGVAVYFNRKGKEYCFACDTWDLRQDNIWAIVKTIEALRGISRWGAGDMMEAAFTGFQALPAPVQRKHWRVVLGVSSDETDITKIRDKWLELVKKNHPDSGGSVQATAEINSAMDEAKKELEE